jgi:hypothetical protein
MQTPLIMQTVPIMSGAIMPSAIRVLVADSGA